MVRQGRDVTPGSKKSIIGIFLLPLTWREVKSLALVVFIGETVVTFAFVLLEESGLDDHLRKLTDFIGCVHLVTVVVISSKAYTALVLSTGHGDSWLPDTMTSPFLV